MSISKKKTEVKAMENRSSRNSSVTRRGVFSFIRIFLICMLLTVGLSTLVTTLIQNDMQRDADVELTTDHEIAQMQIATQFNNIILTHLSLRDHSIYT